MRNPVRRVNLAKWPVNALKVVNKGFDLIKICHDALVENRVVGSV